MDPTKRPSRSQKGQPSPSPEVATLSWKTAKSTRKNPSGTPLPRPQSSIGIGTLKEFYGISPCLSSSKPLEHRAGVISFETEDILQQVDLDFEHRESSNLFSWAKWVTPLLVAFVSFVLSIFVMGFVRLYLQARENRQPTSTKYSAPEAAQIKVDFGNVTLTTIHRHEPPVTYSH